MYTHLISHVSQVDYFNKQCQIASHWGNVNKKQTPVPVVTIFHICYGAVNTTDHILVSIYCLPGHKQPSTILKKNGFHRELCSHE